MVYVIGIDGGGTKTKAVLADQTGQVFATAAGGPSNPNSVTEHEIYESLSELFKSLKKQSPEAFDQVSICFAGMSGVGLDPNQSSLKTVLTNICQPYDMDVELAHDGVIALYVGTGGQDGIVHISGTGSITYAIKDNLIKRAGGWGYLFDDLGSGYSIGKETLAAVLQEYDGRGERTVLTSKVLQYFNADIPPDLVSLIYQASNHRTLIAQLSKLTFDAYEEGDDVSIQIIKQAAKDISHSIKSLANDVYANHDQVNVVLSGGLFKRDHIMIPLIKDDLKGTGHAYNLQLLYAEPVFGAVIGGLKHLGLEISEGFMENILVKHNV
ncbi:N-acetylglucosamine kinase [Tenuibacillus multivorans]|uniref:BadF-type ATPase n=1 Tax=Tenuibacillus multivorans TaxID=237069 RepID=A0A1H0C484_9BACI|nr:ROK family protein [Tenuibacillus multivorans]GEL77760.1 N-acetylmuramic acid/N-acetylglucosamine kinase [Tenuibacillus multivorans]SDN52670.1 BadF-type ATPase [Tenuibacillus multivorans]